MKKRTLAMGLTAAMVMSLLTCPVSAAEIDQSGIDFDSAQALTLNGEISGEITEEGGYLVYSFTPDETDAYYFHVVSEEDTYAYLFDSADCDYALILEDDDSGDGTNACVTWYLDAGKTYYYVACFWDSSATGDLTVYVTDEYADNTLYLGWVSEEDGEYSYDLSNGYTGYYSHYPCYEEDVVFFIITDIDYNQDMTIQIIDPEELELDTSWPYDYSIVDGTDYVHIESTQDQEAWNQEFTISWTDEDGTTYSMSGDSYLPAVALFTEDSFDPEYLVEYVNGGDTVCYDENSADEDYVFWLVADEYYSIESVTVNEWEDFITAEEQEDGSWKITVDSAVFAENNYDDVSLYLTYQFHYYYELVDENGEVFSTVEGYSEEDSWYNLCWTGARLYVGWLNWYDDDEGNYGWYFSTDDCGLSSAYGNWPTDNEYLVFFTAASDEDGNLDADTITYIDPDDMDFGDLRRGWASFEETEDDVLDEEDGAYFVVFYQTDDEEAYDYSNTFYYTNSDGVTYSMDASVSMGGVNVFTEDEYSASYLVNRVVSGNSTGTLSYNESSSEEDYVFWVIPENECYTIEYVNVNEWEDYITAEEQEDGSWKITVDSAVFAANDYYCVALNLSYGVYYYYESVNDEGEVEWTEEWGTDEWGEYFTLYWSGYILGSASLWDDGEGYYYNTDEGVAANRGEIYPMNEYYLIFYLYKMDTDGNITSRTPVDVDEVDGVTISYLDELGVDIADDADNADYYVCVEVDDWDTTYTLTYTNRRGTYSTTLTSNLNTLEWYTSEDFGNTDAVATSGAYNILTATEAYVYLGSIDENIFIPYLADSDGNVVFIVEEDGSLSVASDYVDEENDADWVSEWRTYYETYFTFELVENGIKISLSDEAFQEAFEGSVWIFIQWQNAEDEEDVWDWGTWEWNFYPVEEEETDDTETDDTETDDTNTGNTETDDTETDDTNAGNTETDDTETDDTDTGDTETDDTETDDTDTGDTGTDDAETGDTETDDTDTGDTGTDDAETGDTETEDTATGDTGTDDAETGDTETDDTDTGDTETEETVALVNGLANIGAGWALYKDSEVVDYTGLVYNDKTNGGEYGWYYVVNGYVDFSYSGLVKYDGASNDIKAGAAGWYYVKNAFVDFTYSGLVKYTADSTNGSGTSGWYYVKNAYVDFTVTDVVYNPGTEYGYAGWWYVKNACVDFSYSGLVKHTAADGTVGWYYVKNALVDSSYTGLVYNPGTHGVQGWWYVENALVKFSYTGLCSNDYGTWYVKSGKVDFSYSGPYVYNTVIFTVKGGQVIG